MKKLIIIFLVFFTTTSVSAQNTSSKDAKKIKGMKLIVALSEYSKKATNEEKQALDSINALFEKSMKENWTFSEIDKSMPLSEAKEFVKNNKKTHYYIYLGPGQTSSITQQGWRYIKYGNLLGIFGSSGNRIIYDALPFFEGRMDDAIIVYAIMQLQYLLTILETEEISALIKTSGYVKKNGPKVIKKTLLIPEEYISPKISLDEIKLAYPYDMEICNNEKIARAILDKDPKYAVVFYVMVPAGRNYVHFLYVSDAENGEIYGVITRGNVQIGLGVFGAIGGGKKKYVINNKELKEIGQIVK